MSVRTATRPVSTGTPRATFTRSTASNGFRSPPARTFKRESNCSTESSRQTNSTAACVPMVVVPANIHGRLRRIEPGYKGDHGIILAQWRVPRAGGERCWLGPLRVHIEHCKFALSCPRLHSTENKLVVYREIAKRQILRGRADEDQVVLLRIIERK